MEKELALVRQLRAGICPDLAARAEGANARDDQYTPIDYAAWSRCRQRAERQLVASQRVWFRNKQGFMFYTPEGAALAQQADEVAALKKRHCL